MISAHCSSILLLSLHNIFLIKRQKLLSGEMAGRELRYASGVGHDYSSPKYAQKSLTWESHGAGRGEERKKKGNLVIFQADVIIE